MFFVSEFATCALSLAGEYGCALAYWGFLKFLPDRFRCVPLLQAGLLFILAFPLIIPPERMGLRALALVLGIELWFKMGDFTRHVSARSHIPSFLQYCRFLLPFPFMLVVFEKCNLKRSHPPALARLLCRIILGAAGFGAGFALVHWANGFALLRSSFALDHLVKVSIFVLTLEGLSLALHGVERIVGINTTPIIQHQLLSRSVGEFWSRYNTRVHDWFVNNVYRPAGGLRHPIRSLCLVFLVSAIFHEIGMGIATSRFDGYQFTFFAIQAPGVLLSHRLHRFARGRGLPGRVITHTFTLAWMLASSVLFFHGVNRIFPFFYSAEPWLP